MTTMDKLGWFAMGMAYGICLCAFFALMGWWK
jgi:hypothetical protein